MALQTCQEVQRLVQLLRETECSDAYAENWPTASNGSLELVAYIYMCSPGHLKIAGVAGHPPHTQEHLQAIQVLSDQMFSP